MLRKSKKDDVLKIMTVIESAKGFLKSCGVDQWQDGYPNVDVILDDILQDCSYVLLSDNEIVGTTMLSFDGEPTYDVIHEGAWLSNEPFAVMHRVALDDSKRGSGLSTRLFTEIEAVCLGRGIHSIKVDTHEDNKVMQKVLKKHGFTYCGVIYLTDGAKRLAFEKLL